METPYETPIDYCIRIFGGEWELSGAIHRHRNQLKRWQDQGGMIAAQAQTDILIAARKRNIEIDPAKLVYDPIRQIETHTFVASTLHRPQPE